MTGISPINPRVEKVIILQGDDDEKVRELRTEITRIEARKPTKAELNQASLMGENSSLDTWQKELDAAKKAHDDFSAKAEKRGVTVVLRALGRKTYRELIAKHPPRDDDEQDKGFGANIDTLSEDLVPACIASPAGTAGAIADFLDSLNEGQFGDLSVKAWQLNVGRTADPTQRLSSVASHTSNGTSI